MTDESPKQVVADHGKMMSCVMIMYGTRSGTYEVRFEDGRMKAMSAEDIQAYKERYGNAPDKGEASAVTVAKEVSKHTLLFNRGKIVYHTIKASGGTTDSHFVKFEDGTALYLLPHELEAYKGKYGVVPTDEGRDGDNDKNEGEGDVNAGPSLSPKDTKEDDPDYVPEPRALPPSSRKAHWEPARRSKRLAKIPSGGDSLCLGCPSWAACLECRVKRRIKLAKDEP